MSVGLLKKPIKQLIADKGNFFAADEAEELQIAA